MKFNLIIGNPPYQAPQNHAGKRGGGASLWDKFVLKGIAVCADDGYMCMVHPPGWRAPRGRHVKVKDEILSKNLLYLECHDSRDGQKTFGAGTAYDIYLWQNCVDYAGTECSDGIFRILEHGPLCLVGAMRIYGAYWHMMVMRLRS